MLISGTRTSEDQSQSLVKMGVKIAHLASHIANAEAIQQAQDGTIELSEQALNRAGTGLAGVFPSAHISAMMQAVFDGPMRSHQRQHPCWRREPHGETAQSIDDFVAKLIGFEDADRAFEPKDLFNACPLLAKPVIEVRAAHEVAMLQSSMRFVPGLCFLPAPPIRRGVLQ